MDFLITSCLLVCGSFVVVYFVLFEIYHLKLVDYVFHRKCKNCLYFYVFWILQYRLLQFLLNKSYAIVFCLMYTGFFKISRIVEVLQFWEFLGFIPKLSRYLQIFLIPIELVYNSNINFKTLLSSRSRYKFVTFLFFNFSFEYPQGVIEPTNFPSLQDARRPALSLRINCFIFSSAHKEAKFEIFFVKFILWVINFCRGYY